MQREELPPLGPLPGICSERAQISHARVDPRRRDVCQFWAQSMENWGCQLRGKWWRRGEIIASALGGGATANLSASHLGKPVKPTTFALITMFISALLGLMWPGAREEAETEP